MEVEEEEEEEEAAEVDAEEVLGARVEAERIAFVAPRRSWIVSMHAPNLQKGGENREEI